MVGFTTNKGLGLPTVGGDTGVWGPPLNNNSSVLDASLGGSVTIPVSSVSGALTLLSSNYNNIFLSFTGAITQNTAITLPAVGSIYVIQNLTTNTSAFRITLLTTAAGGQVIGIPPYEQTEIMTDGSNVKFRGLPHVGSYWDYGGSSVPSWVAACTVPPWLNCDGTAFSSVTYPYLAVILGGTTLPDARGRVRAALNQGTNRVTSGVSGVNGDAILSGGGDQNMQVHSHGNFLSDPGHAHTVPGPSGNGVNVGPTTGYIQGAGSLGTTTNGTGISLTNVNAGTGTGANVQPTYIGGLTLIRAA